MKKIKLLATQLVISSILFAQKNDGDTTIFLSITVLEQQTIAKDVYGSVTRGEHFGAIYILTDKGDTISVENNFPFLVLKKRDFLKLSSGLCFSNNLYLFLPYENQSMNFLIKIPLTLCGKRNWLLISHPKLKSKYFNCFFSFQFLDWNTGGLKIAKGIDVLNSK